jgi:hypothetical protein
MKGREVPDGLAWRDIKQAKQVFVETRFSAKTGWIWTNFANERHIIGYDEERCFKAALVMDIGCGLILRR